MTYYEIKGHDYDESWNYDLLSHSYEIKKNEIKSYIYEINVKIMRQKP